jgi:hypothetical protein
MNTLTPVIMPRAHTPMCLPCAPSPTFQVLSLAMLYNMGLMVGNYQYLIQVGQAVGGQPQPGAACVPTRELRQHVVM